MPFTVHIFVIARVLESIAKKEISKSWLGKSLQHPLQEEGGGGAGEEGPECSHDLDTTWRGWAPDHLPRDGTCVRVRVN